MSKIDNEFIPDCRHAISVCAATHTVRMAVAGTETFLQLQPLLVCQLYNFDLCDNYMYL